MRKRRTRRVNRKEADIAEMRCRRVCRLGDSQSRANVSQRFSGGCLILKLLPNNARHAPLIESPPGLLQCCVSRSAEVTTRTINHSNQPHPFDSLYPLPWTNKPCQTFAPSTRHSSVPWLVSKILLVRLQTKWFAGLHLRNCIYL